MVVLPTKEDLSQASGTIPFSTMEYYYESFIDQSLVGMGDTIVLHLDPVMREDPDIIETPKAPRAYNPFFNSSARPSAGGKNRGVQVEHRDIPYTAHVLIGPKPSDEARGIGKIDIGQAQTTTVIASLDDIKKCRSATIRGEVYRVMDKPPRQIGLTKVKYIMQIWERVQEKEDGVA
jgi:hypothetical protein